MTALFVVLVVYLLVWGVALALDRWSFIDAIDTGEPASPNNLVLERSSNAREQSHPVTNRQLRFLLAFGWCCAKGGRAGDEVERLLIWLFDRLESEPQLAPRHVRSEITLHVARLMEGDPGDVAVRVHRRCLPLRPTVTQFFHLLRACHVARRYTEIVDLWRKRRDLVRLVGAAARAEDSTPVPREMAIHTLEIACNAHIEAEGFDPERWEQDALFLLEHTTEKYLQRVDVGHTLLAAVDRTRDARRIVHHVEKHIPARGPDDFTNFQDVFSLCRWPVVRGLLTDPRLRLELDRYVTRHDRRSFYRVLHGGTQ